MPTPHPLLEQQRIDAAGDALRAEREALPERAALAENEAHATRAETEQGEVRERLGVLVGDERRVESEVGALRKQAAEIEKTLYAGKVSALSELEGLQEQLATVRQKASALEDEQLTLLETQEELQEKGVALERETEALVKARRALSEALAQSEARIDARLEEIAREAAAHLPTLPAPLRTVYDRLRSAGRHRGRVVVALEKDVCGACHSTLPMTLVARIRAASRDEHFSCESCQRLVVAPELREAPAGD